MSLPNESAAIPAGTVAWAEVDLDAIVHNVRAFKRHVGERVEVIAIVKGNAYGHGIVPVSRAALEAGATRLGVHRATEGMELRRAGIDAPIIVMGYTPPDGVDMLLEHSLTPSLITLDFARALSARAAERGVGVPVHVKVDTGMSRYGLMPPEVPAFLRELQRLPALEIEGLFTHFATSDSSDPTYVLEQLRVFQAVIAEAGRLGVHFSCIHAANSAAAMRLPETLFSAMRLGIAMYGLDPSDEWPPVFEIRPALALKGRISRVRELPAGAGVSYGRTYVTSVPTTAALVPVGYGDGFHRILSNQASVLLHGQRAPLIGRVCMDQFVVDVSAIPGVQQDDVAVVIGRQGEDCIRAEEVARLAGTINYEITTSLLPRLPRLYLRDGQVVEVTSPGI